MGAVHYSNKGKTGRGKLGMDGHLTMNESVSMARWDRDMKWNRAYARSRMHTCMHTYIFDEERSLTAAFAWGSR